MTWFLCALLLAAPNSGKPKAKFEAAQKAFDRYEYPKAVKRLHSLLGDPEFVDGPQRQYARLLLAFSLLLSEQREAAALQLAKLFAENVDYAIAREDTHPDLLRFFDMEHEKYVATRLTPASPQPASALATAPPVPASEPASSPVLVSATPTSLPMARTLGDRHQWLRIFPAGIGHFANHDFAGGAAFLSLEAVFLAGHIVFGVLHRQQLTSDGLFYGPDTTNGPAFQVITDVAGLAAIALVIIDVLDAFIWSPARGRATLSPTVSLGPFGDFRVRLGF